MDAERIDYIEKLNQQEELSREDVQSVIDELRRMQAALWKITDLVDSEADDPLDDAIRIATAALRFPDAADLFKEPT